MSLLPYSVSHLQWLLSFGSHLLVTCHAWQRVLALLWLLVQCKHVLSDGPSSLAACCGCIDTLLLRPQQTSLLLSLLLLLPAAAAPFSSSLALTPFGQACRSETAAWCRWHASPCFRQALCYSVLRCLAVLLCSWYAFFNLIACLVPLRSLPQALPAVCAASPARDAGCAVPSSSFGARIGRLLL